MKKFILYVLKLIILLALLVPIVILTIFLALAIGCSDMPEAVQFILFFGAMGIIASAYIVFTVWLSRQWNDRPAGDAGFLKKAKTPFLLLLNVTAIALIIGNRGLIEDKFERFRAQRCVASADEVVRYENSGDVYIELMGTDLIQSSAAINYSKMQVAFIYHMGYGDVKYVRLQKTGSLPEKYIQFRAELKEPGRYFYTYYPENAEEYWDYCHTSGVGIEMADGSYYYAALDNELLDFDGISARISKAIEKAELIIPYGSKPVPALGMGLETDSVLIDLDGMTVAVVYRSTGGFPENQDMEAFHIKDDIPLEKIQTDEHKTQKRSIEQDGYTLYGYTDSSDLRKIGGFILTTPDGEMYEAHEWGYYGW